MRLTNDEKAILLGLLEDIFDEEDIEQQPMDIKATIVSVIRKLGGTYFGKHWNRTHRMWKMMPNREKVIKGLMVCVDRIPGEYSCNECPYEIDGNDCEINMIKDAIALLKEQEGQIKNRDESLEKAREEIKWLRGMLKEQEAVEPGIAQDVDGIFATCGNCKKKLWKMMGMKFVVNPDEMPRFCPHCGRLVKWSGTN